MVQAAEIAMEAIKRSVFIFMVQKHCDITAMFPWCYWVVPMNEQWLLNAHIYHIEIKLWKKSIYMVIYKFGKHLYIYAFLKNSSYNYAQKININMYTRNIKKPCWGNLSSTDPILLLFMPLRIRHNTVEVHDCKTHSRTEQFLPGRNWCPEK